MELIGVYGIGRHVGAGLTPYNLIQISNGNTFAKLSAIGLVREEAVVAA